jgi:hypothetical protein
MHMSSDAPQLLPDPALGPLTLYPRPQLMGAGPQIWSNWTSGSTGQLSATTCIINLIGCIVRIFTTISENAGVAMLRFVSIAFDNAILMTCLCQCRATWIALHMLSGSIS